MADQLISGSGGPEAARSEIERTRARMSDTLDEIEEVLIRKKEHFRETMDVGARLREKPMVTAGVVLGAGFLIGFLTGGKDKKGEAERISTQARAALWEERARRLLAIAREQEESLDDLENSVLDAAAPAATVRRWGYSARPAYAFTVSDDDRDELEDLDEDLDGDYPSGRLHRALDDQEEDDEDDLDEDELDEDLDEDDLEDDDDDDDYDDDQDDDYKLVGSSRRSGKAGLKEGVAGKFGGFISDFAQALVEGVRKQM